MDGLHDPVRHIENQDCTRLRPANGQPIAKTTFDEDEAELVEEVPSHAGSVLPPSEMLPPTEISVPQPGRSEVNSPQFGADVEEVSPSPPLEAPSPSYKANLWI